MNPVEHSAVYLVTGPMAAGKSTVARMLAARFERGVYIDGDFFRRSIVSGREDLSPDLEEGALRQLDLRYRISSAVAAAYCSAGFTVVVEDVIAGPHLPSSRLAWASRRCMSSCCCPLC